MTSLKHAGCLQEGARSSSYSSIWLTGCGERCRPAGLRAPHPCLWLAVCFLPICCAGPAVVYGLASVEPRAGRPRCASASTLLWAICRRHASPSELPLDGSPCHWLMLLLRACLLICSHHVLERSHDDFVISGPSPSGRLARGVPCRKSRALGCISALRPSLGHHCRPLCLQLVRRLHALSVRLLVCTSWQHPCYGRRMLSILLEQSKWLGCQCG